MEDKWDDGIELKEVTMNIENYWCWLCWMFSTTSCLLSIGSMLMLKHSIISCGCTKDL